MPTYGLYLSTLVHEFIGIYVRKLSKLFFSKERITLLNAFIKSSCKIGFSKYFIRFNYCTDFIFNKYIGVII